MSTNVTPTEVLEILDLYGDTYLLNDSLVQNNKITIAGNYIFGNGTPVAGTGDQTFINALMNVNAAQVTTPVQFAKNTALVQPQFSALASWITRSAGVSTSTIDGYLSYYNSATTGALYSYLAEPNTALQYYLCAGQNPLTTTTPTTMMTPSNVYAPQMQFGAATVGAAAAVTYTDELSIPTTNNGLQTLTITGASAGTFIAQFVVSGATVSTAAITYTGSLSAATIQTAVNATSIGASQVRVYGSNGGPWYFDFYGSKFVNTLITPIVIVSSLTGDGAVATVSTAVNAAYLLTVNATGGTLGFNMFGQAGTIAYTVSTTAAAMQTAMAGLSSTGTGQVTVTGANGGPYTVALTGNLANQYAAPFTVTSSALTGGTSTAKVQQTFLGSQQGFTPTKGLTANVTTTINDTFTVQVTFDGWSSAGAVVTGHTATATLDNLTAGQSASFSMTTSGDRIRHITAVASTAGAATAGAFTLDSLIERTPL